MCLRDYGMRLLTKSEWNPLIIIATTQRRYGGYSRQQSSSEEGMITRSVEHTAVSTYVVFREYPSVATTEGNQLLTAAAT